MQVISYIGNPYGPADVLDEVAFHIAVYGCVSYCPRVSGTVYRTGFIYIVVDDDGGFPHDRFWRGKGDIPEENLCLREWKHDGLIC